MKRKSAEISFDEAIAKSVSESSSIENPINPFISYGVLLGVFLFALIGIGRLIQIGLVNGSFYSNRASSNINKEISIVAPRGIITDRYGKPLLANTLAFSAFLNVSEMVKYGEEDKALAAFKEILGINSEDVLGKLDLADLESVNDVKIAEDITREQNIRLASLNLYSVSVQNDYKRKYGDVSLSHIVGYVGLPQSTDLSKNKKLSLIDVIGRSGLEAYYNSSLSGVDGKKVVYKNAKGQSKDVESVKDAKSGEDLKTTIDADLQRYFYDRLVYNTNLRGQVGAVGIALNPKTGEILSLISLPSFDANNVGKYLNVATHPLFDRAVAGVYNPGSTIKPLHAVAGLHEGVINKALQIFSHGYIEVPNPYFPDKPSRYVDHFCCGLVNVDSALAVSSNVYFYSVGGGLPPSESGIVNGAFKMDGLGIGKLNEYWDKFGLNKKSGIDLAAEASGFLPNPTEKEKRTGQPWRVGDTYNVSIGQGDLSINMIQLADYIAAVANKGKAYKPHIAVKENPETLMDLSEFAAEFKQVEVGMEDSIYKPYGTSYSMHNLSFKVAAKTGTAQTNLNTRTNALFVGYGPTDAKEGPSIEVLVLIENAVEGSLNAIPVAKDVLEWYYYNRILTQK